MMMSHTCLPLSQAESDNAESGQQEVVNEPNPPRLKVLVSAYACSPSRGSESGVGWGWVQAISKYHDLWVLTAAHYKDEIESELQRRPDLQGKVHFHYIPRKRYLWAERLWPPAYLFTYKNQWQTAAYQPAICLHDEIHFDIIHQLTYVGFRVPGHLWKLDTPFVWGPIGGLEQTRWSLIPSLGLRGGLHFTARNLINDWDRRFSRAPRLAFAKANGGIISATTGIKNEIRRFYGFDSTVISEIGIPPVTRQVPVRRQPDEPLLLLWSALHIPRKALPFLLSALKMLPANMNWKLTILGGGPCSAKWRRLARTSGVADRCEWLGQVSRQTVLEKMQAAHVLVITSVYDLTSTVLVEALANGLPVICPDHCGFTDAVTPECGIKVSAASKNELVASIRDGIVRLNDENVRFALATGAIKQSTKFDWDEKAKAVSDIYRGKATLSRRAIAKAKHTMK